MKKNMLVFDTTNFTAPDSDGRPAVRFEEVEVVPSGDGVTDSIIVKLTGANTEANNRITELEARLKVAEAERDAMRDAINRTKSNVLAAIIRGALEKAEKAKAELTEVRGVCVEIGEDREREYQKCKAAEAQLAEAQERIKTLEAANASWKHYHDAGSAAYERATAAEARAEAAEKQLAEAKEEIATLAFAAHMPADYPYGLPSWICQRLYAAYIAQASNKKEWNALMRALDAKERAEARLKVAEERAEAARCTAAVAKVLLEEDRTERERQLVKENNRLRIAGERATTDFAEILCKAPIWKCTACGVVMTMENGAAWRWNGGVYEHQCAGPQAGCFPGAPVTPNDVAELEARVGQLEAALKAVEYFQAYELTCPWCFSFDSHGHKPDCARQSALEPARQAEGERGVEG